MTPGSISFELITYKGMKNEGLLFIVLALEICTAKYLALRKCSVQHFQLCLI
jgi:hypothetical protein